MIAALDDFVPKPMTDALRAAMADAVGEVSRAIDAMPDTNKTAILKAAGVSHETVRKWVKRMATPSLRTLVKIADPMEHRVVVHLLPLSGGSPARAAALDHLRPRGGGHEGSMNGDRDDWDELTAEQKEKVRIFISGLKAAPNPLKPSRSKRPDRARKASK